jgi:Tol biopolymer transport system component
MLAIALLGAAASVAAHLPTKVMERVRAKRWITVASRRQIDPFRFRIIVSMGGAERAISLADSDVGALALSVSRGGTKIAFFTYVPGMGATGRKLCFIETTGTGYTELLDTDGLEIAWSHDEQRLAFTGSMSGGSTGVIVLDIRSRPPRVLIERPLASGPDGTGSLTSQVWSPDNRRLVYVDRAGDMRILDVETGVEEKLGPGRYPTWSPDGRYIAYRESTKAEGDYYVTPVGRRGERRRILRNRPSLSDILAGRAEYVDAALWSPDGEFLLLNASRARTGWTS